MEGSINREKCYIGNIPAIIWAEKSEKAFIYVHGKMSCKENAEEFAKIAQRKGYQTISFDLPEHGERSDKNATCDIWNGKNDLMQIADYSWKRWNTLSLYACSMGAHFSLYTYANQRFETCLFQSPIVDMDYVITLLFQWFHVSVDLLREKKVIETPFHRLSWDYYCFLKENPINTWTIPTSILYAAKDGLQTREAMERFANTYHCELTIAEHSEHGFVQGYDLQVEKDWLEQRIQ